MTRPVILLALLSLLTVGVTYRFDAFHAERHTVESNFRMETSIDCLVIY